VSNCVGLSKVWAKKPVKGANQATGETHVTREQGRGLGLHDPDSERRLMGGGKTHNRRPIITRKRS